jgi:2'-5' RNA ligase
LDVAAEGAPGALKRESAVIVRTSLPAGLERLRRDYVADWAACVPAHVTLLYPFVAPERLEPKVRSSLARVARRHLPFDYTLNGSARWPDTVYVQVDPEAPFVSLQGDLQAAFAEYPVYEGRVPEFVPHVTVAEGACVNRTDFDRLPAWSSLPSGRTARAIEVIAMGENGRWRIVWRIPLGGGVGAVGRMPA